MTPQQSQAFLHRIRTRRRLIQLCAGVLCIFVLISFGAYHRTQDVLPPTYGKWQIEELQLAQHDASLPYPEGGTGRYIYFANRATEIGWGNYMQEALMNAYLAEKGERTFVFDNYTWSEGEAEYVRFGLSFNPLNKKLIPSRIPFTAVITGAPFGGPMPAASDHPRPRSVRKEFYDEVCPQSERLILSSKAVSSKTEDGQWVTAKETIERWASLLKSVSFRCIEITEGKSIFDWTMMDTTRNLIEIWPEFKGSPMLSTLEWSPLVQAAYTDNQAVFDLRAQGHRRTLQVLDRSEEGAGHLPSHSTSVPGLLAVHIRRGDWGNHCKKVMSSTRTPFNAFNAFPAFHDAFTPPSTSISQAEAWEVYRPRCWPTMNEHIEKIEAIRRQNPNLHSIYVLSNAPRAWVQELLEKLHRRHPWQVMGGSRDLKLTFEQKYIAQSVDMFIAQRAEVFIGNGFSSLTSNVVMLRMAHDSPPDSNRFW